LFRIIGFRQGGPYQGLPPFRKAFSAAERIGVFQYAGWGEFIRPRAVREFKMFALGGFFGRTN
jgi:hypothetical protein